MTRIPNGAGVSLEEDRFEVDCWRYVGDPAGYGSRSSGRPPRGGMLDLGKSAVAGSSEKSDGWFGLNKHKRNRTISLQKKSRSDLVPPYQLVPSSSGSVTNTHLSTTESSRNLIGSSASSTLPSSSGSTLRSPSFANSAGQNIGISESGSGLGAGLGGKKNSTKGKKERSSFFGLGVGNRRNRKEEVESWRRTRLICQGDLRGDDSVVTVYDGDDVIYQFRPCNLHSTDISVPHKSVYSDRLCIRIANIGKAMIRDVGETTPTLTTDNDAKRLFFQSSPDGSSGSLPGRANSLGEPKRKTSTTPSLRSFASSHSLSLGSRPPPVPPIDSSLKTPASSPYPPQLSPQSGQLTPLTGPWLSPVTSNTSTTSSPSTHSSTSAYSTAREEEAKDGLSPLVQYSPLSEHPPGNRDDGLAGTTTPKAKRTYHRKPSNISYRSDETIPTISLHGVQPSSSPRSTSTFDSISELAFGFEDAQLQQAWFGLLKALSRPEIVSDFRGFTGRGETLDPLKGGKRRRIHRTLEVTVHDIKDLKILPKKDLAGTRKRGIMRSISSGIGQTIKSLAEDDREEQGQDLGDSYFLEIRLDNQVIAKTSSKTLPLGLNWSETFHFTDIADWHRLSFHLFRTSVEGRPVSMSSTSILAADLESGRAVEGRYPFSNLMDEASGELRLKLRSVTMTLGDAADYIAVQTALSNPCKDSLDIVVYATTIPGGSVSLCHAGTALCSLDDLVRILIDEEVQTPAATLFRANTPLTKLLETAMRIYAYDYVRTAVGPTVRDICERDLVLDALGRETSTNHSETLSPFVQSLWENIYMSRHSFPTFLKKVLRHLMLAVSKQHKDSKKLQFQAVSSFLFLRLIGPAIMWPTMFDIVPAPPSSGVQRTLKALAKPVMSLAFLVEASEQNLQDKATNDFVEENSAALIDFLEACATFDDDNSVFAIDRRVEDIAAALIKRRSGLSRPEQDAILVLSSIGAVDLLRELAIMSDGRPVSEPFKQQNLDSLTMDFSTQGGKLGATGPILSESKGYGGDDDILSTLGKVVNSSHLPINGESRLPRVADLATPNISKRTSSLSGTHNRNR